MAQLRVPIIVRGLLFGGAMGNQAALSNRRTEADHQLKLADLSWTAALNQHARSVIIALVALVVFGPRAVHGSREMTNASIQVPSFHRNEQQYAEPVVRIKEKKKDVYLNGTFETCTNNESYRSPQGLPCEMYNRLSCYNFGHVGFSSRDVDELMLNCPMSCDEANCGGQQANRTHFFSPAFEGSYPRGTAVSTNSIKRVAQAIEDTEAEGCENIDDPNYKSVQNLRCQDYIRWDCTRFSLVGFSEYQTYHLVTSCPQSCNIPCGTFTVSPSAAPSSVPTISKQPSAMPSLKPSSSPSISPTPIPSSFPSGVPSDTPSVSPSSQPSASPSVNPTSLPSTMPSETPTLSPSTSPSSDPSGIPSSMPSSGPSSLPSSTPTATPSVSPTNLPSSNPSSSPTSSPSSIPSSQPSSSPSTMPSDVPSATPTSTPSADPSKAPSMTPTSDPSASPSSIPSTQPSSSPSTSPSLHPSYVPTTPPSSMPSKTPSTSPTTVPSAFPSAQPSLEPTTIPSSHPTSTPSSAPTSAPSSTPSSSPSGIPSSMPSSSPSDGPSSNPSAIPSSSPSSSPSSAPSSSPSANPSSAPSSTPSSSPSSNPSSSPSSLPSSGPSSIPSSSPSSGPSARPSSAPSSSPSASPSSLPSSEPSSTPSQVPTSQPSSTPSASPSSAPSSSPTGAPSVEPTVSMMPSTIPSSAPTPSGIEMTTTITLPIIYNWTQVMRYEDVAVLENTALDFVKRTKLDTDPIQVDVTTVDAIALVPNGNRLRNDDDRRLETTAWIEFNATLSITSFVSPYRQPPSFVYPLVVTWGFINGYKVFLEDLNMASPTVFMITPPPEQEIRPVPIKGDFNPKDTSQSDSGFDMNKILMVVGALLVVAVILTLAYVINGRVSRNDEGQVQQEEQTDDHVASPEDNDDNTDYDDEFSLSRHLGRWANLSMKSREEGESTIDQPTLEESMLSLSKDESAISQTNKKPAVKHSILETLKELTPASPTSAAATVKRKGKGREKSNGAVLKETCSIDFLQTFQE